mmetsp:Transcript_8971/g.23109  ORF Transcript_8971/g.23109 Transcript_8971/m.23109 type:complete len:229 (+) Transcript_8971:1026-1712(+)
MGHGLSPSLHRNLNLPLGNERTGDGGTEQVHTLVQGVSPEHGEHKVLNKFLAQVINVNLLYSGSHSLLTGWLKLLTLAKVGRERDHLAVVGILQPLQDDGGVQTAGIGQHHLVDAILSGVHLDVAGAMAHNTNADGAGAAHPGSAHRGVLGRDRRGCGKTATGSSVQISRVNLGKFGQVNLGQAGPNFTVGESTWPLGDSQQLLEGQQLSLLKPRATNSPPFETHQPP